MTAIRSKQNGESVPLMHLIKMLEIRLPIKLGKLQHNTVCLAIFCGFHALNATCIQFCAEKIDKNSTFHFRFATKKTFLCTIGRKIKSWGHNLDLSSGVKLGRQKRNRP